MDPQPNQKIVKESNISFKTQNDIDVKKVSLINTVKQVEESYAIAFNNSGSIVVTGCNETIKVWSFEQGRMIEKQKLVGHTDIIYCLVFSQKHNWFASSSKDYTLRCWKEDENKDWISSQPGKSHSNNIYCLILTNQEDQIISCSGDQTIKVWKVNYIINQLEYYYTLDNKHTNSVYSLSLNESDENLNSQHIENRSTTAQRKSKMFHIHKIINE